VILLLFFAGFARSYYLRVWISTRVLAPILHVHGLIMSAWIVLFIVQIAFVAKHRIQVHRKLGVLGASLALVILGLGVFIIVRDIERQSPDATAASFSLSFVAFDGINLILFAGFVFLALLMRRRSDIHKRLMLMATISLLPPALGRIAIHFVQDEKEPITKLALMAACVLLVVAIDTLRHRRLHPAFGWAATLVLALNYATYLAQISS
jgi:hypothetical protein